MKTISSFLISCFLCLVHLFFHQQALACGNQYVSATLGSPAGDGSLLNPYNDVQDAIDNACVGDTVFVQEGTYLLTQDIRLKSGTVLRGSYDASWVYTGNRTMTVLDGQNTTDVLVGIDLALGTVAESFTVRNGFNNLGGGISMSTSDVLLNNLIVEDCVTGDTGENNYTNGGGINLSGGSPIVQSCLIRNNTTVLLTLGAEGGGIYAQNLTNGIIRDCIIEGNQANRGGGVYFIEGTLNIENTSIRNNNADVTGGGLSISHSTTLTTLNISASIMESNTANNAGAIYAANQVNLNLANTLIYKHNTPSTIQDFNNSGTDGSMTLDHCTLADNNCNYTLDLNNTDLTISNSIIRNTATLEEINSSSNPNITVQYSNIEGGFVGTNNIDAAPFFVDAANEDYHLQDSSPCIATADPSSSLTNDLDLFLRPNPAGTNPDMGAYENGTAISCSGGGLGCLFPGDCNLDGEVNFLDLFCVGQAIGATGSVRPNGNGTPFYQLTGPDWGSSLVPNLNDKKYADCNGDGLVDLADLAVVYQNYNKLIGGTAPTSSRLSSSNIQLRPKFIGYMDGNNTIALYEIILEDIDNPFQAIEAYFLNFEVDYSSNLAIGAEGFFAHSSFGIRSQDMQAYYKDFSFADVKTIDIGLTRIIVGIGDVDIHGTTCEVGCIIAIHPILRIVTQDYNGGNLRSSNLLADNYEPLTISIKNASIQTKDGTILPVQGLSTTVYVLPYTYCLPDTTNHTGNTYIDHFKIGDYQFSTRNNDGFASFTKDTVLQVNSGQSYPFTIETASTNTTARYYSIYIDHDQSGTFETNELVYQSGATYGDAFSDEITIDSSMPFGERLMRVIFTTDLPASDACPEMIEGEVEDYWIKVNEVLPLTLSATTVIMPTCPSSKDGSVALMADGGCPPYLFGYRNQYDVWDTLAANQLNDLGAGTYAFVVQDACGTLEPLLVTLTTPNPLTIGQTRVIHPTCSGMADGVIEVTNVNGGTYPYTYILNDHISQASPIFNKLPPGLYTIKVVDANGCEVKKRRPIKLGVYNTLALKVIWQADASSPTSADGAVLLILKGSSYRNTLYSIDGGLNWQNSGLFTGLAAGDYEILAKNEQGCHTSTTVTIKHSISKVPLLSYSLHPNVINHTASNILTINKPQKSNIGQMEYYNYEGRKLGQLSLNQQNGSQLFLSTEQLKLSKGLVYLVLYDESGDFITSLKLFVY